MRTITTVTKVFQFDELSENAKDTARQWFIAGGLDYEWWDATYEDAERIGLKIKEFDLDRSRHANGYLTVSVIECCSRIISEHGKQCDTYALAQRTFKEKHEGKDIDVDEFQRELLEEYSVMLQHESEYLQSNEYVDDNIRINEYEFTEDGEVA